MNEFEKWMKKVDKEVRRITGGFGVEELSDWCFRDAFDDGVTPEEAALGVIGDDDLASMFLEDWAEEYS